VGHPGVKCRTGVRSTEDVGNVFRKGGVCIITINPETPTKGHNGHVDQGSSKHIAGKSQLHKHHVIESVITSEIPMGSEPLDQTLIGGLLLFVCTLSL
jgi:hypothetical protein